MPEVSVSAILSVPYREVALASGLVSAACLTALVVVASIRNAQALATTAIVLAIITFIVQLIVYVAQAEQSRHENELTQKLHAELASSLAALDARAHGTEEMVAKINDKVLDKALQLTGSGKFENFPPEFVRDLAQNVSELLELQSTGQLVADQVIPENTQFPTKDWGPDEDERVMSLLSTWPDDQDEIERLRERLTGLDESAAFMLRQFASDELENREVDSRLAPSWFASPDGHAAELFKRGLVENFPSSAYGVDMALAHLTEVGREAARVFTAPGPPPVEVADLVHEVQEAAERMQVKVDEGRTLPGSSEL